MRVPVRTLYATRALYELALLQGQTAADGAPTRNAAAQAPVIAERQGIPLAFLEQILQDLRKAGLVAARRGPHGGYTLASPASEIKLADVVRATTSGAVAAEPAKDVVALAWGEVTARIDDLLASTTMADLLARSQGQPRAAAPPPATMYFI